MTDTADLMASLLQIPYFSALAEKNGEAWLGEIFAQMEIEDLDISTAYPAIAAALVSKGAADPNFVATVKQADDSAADAALPQIPVAGNAKAKAFSSIAMPEKATEFFGDLPHEDTTTDDTEAEPFKFDNAASNAESLEVQLSRIDSDHGRFFSFLAQYWAARTSTTFGDSNNNIVLNGSNETMGLGAGNDNVYISAANTADRTFDTTNIRGGAGTDALYLYRDARHFNSDSEIANRGFTVTLNALNDFGAYGGKVRLDGIENIFGTDHDDNLTGDNGDNLLSGRGGNDTLNGGDGKDTLKGGDGNDVINGGNNGDTLDGGDGKDKLNGDGGADTINGAGGDDTIFGGDGNDNLDGGSGNDTLNGGADDDLMTGGSGEDILNGDAGDDKLDGGNGDDTISGGAGDDVILGGDGNDNVNGDAGKDEIDGGAGNDTIKGGAGKDKLIGGTGEDKLQGGADSDTLTGGTDADRFYYEHFSESKAGATTRDIITDFKVSEDIFDFSDLLLSEDAIASSFSFVGTTAFSNVKGEVRFVKQDLAGSADDVTIVQVDNNGDGTADFEIQLTGLHTLTVTNFDF